MLSTVALEEKATEKIEEYIEEYMGTYLAPEKEAWIKGKIAVFLRTAMTKKANTKYWIEKKTLLIRTLSYFYL